MRTKQLNVNEVVVAYRSGRSIHNIATGMGTSFRLVKRCLVACGETIRRKDGKYGDPFTVDVDFFKQWNHDVAYMLGYISADGHVRPHKYELKLKSIDYDLLEYAKSVLKTNYEIKPEKGTNCYILSIYSAKVVSDLLRHGIKNRKSLTINFPDIPDEFFWSYMRGLVDGDGHVRPCRSTSREIAVQINGNKKYLTKMLHILGRKIGCPIYALNPQGKSAAVGIYGKYAYECLTRMYENNLWGLPRKKDAAHAAIINYDTNRLVVCECGERIEHAHHNRQYCIECSKQRDRECRKRYKIRSRQTRLSV